MEKLKQQGFNVVGIALQNADDHCWITDSNMMLFPREGHSAFPPRLVDLNSSPTKETVKNEHSVNNEPSNENNQENGFKSKIHKIGRAHV